MVKKFRNRPVILCSIIFLICLLARVIEYFFIQTDETILAENFIHKIFGLIVLFVVLKMLAISWKDIGFSFEGIFTNIGKGLLLAAICFLISYTAECILLFLQNGNVGIKCYVSGFSLTGESVNQTGIVFVLLCIVFNIINILMEEGIFRGLFIYVLNKKMVFYIANIIAALFFGVWHWIMPVRDYINGQSSVGNLLFMGVGYIILAGIMSLKWGLLYRMSGNIWIGAGDHLFNNIIATNLVHTISNGEADHFQIIRILLAQVISFCIVFILYRRYKTNHGAN